MVTKTIFRKTNQLYEELDVKINVLWKERNDIVLTAEKSLIFVDEYVRRLKAMISVHHFENVADEIYFFKELKPLFISKFIYYSKVLEIEALKPNADNKTLKDFYETEQVKLQIFYNDNSEFYSYYRRKATYLDHKYFTRKSNDLKMRLSSSLYDLDEQFTTSHDSKVSIIKADELLQNYFTEQIRIIENPKSDLSNFDSKLSWSSSKVSLLEVLYSLHLTQCFNGGNIEFIEVVRETEKILRVDLGNFYKTIGEIKSRKYNRTKFLELLTNNLNKAIDDNLF
ncbi:RteC domain-containing protein [Epilithonimonas hispanica]|uniref:RteC protein n=1 Tax=Epilithonimonas hispanica TaxID=358687 RepID=A0A3D9CTM6_9FLAO|nr:RteC domain-containing protein [Epilithonimonas hispanica]REC69130.1 RteC protein [Epilithonimonas hispanica]